MKEDNRFSIDRQFDQKYMEYYSLLPSFVEECEINYWIGNPSVQIINGSIALKSLQKPQQHYQSSESYFKALQQINQNEEKNQLANIKNYYLLLDGVPNNKGPSQLLYNSPLSQYQSDIVQVRVIRTNQLRYYGVLLLFTSQKIGRECFQNLLGIEYNQIQIERIILRQISQIFLFHKDHKRGQSVDLLRRKRSQQTENQKLSPDHIFYTSGRDNTVGMKPEEKHTCSICLEELNGQIISILCGHYFHRHCLQGWEYNTCPLCRYYQQPPVVSFCEQCNQSDGLWVCLLCGRRLCCGTVNDIMSEDSHIYQHCKQSGHALSMEIQTRFLFDARVPAFLHQMFYQDLIQKGKEEQIIEGKDSEKKSKVSQKISHYQKQVAEQMLKQRQYFEQNLNKIIKNYRYELNSRKDKIQQKSKQLENLKEEQLNLTKQNKELSEELQKSEKEEKVINTLLKMKEQKVQESKKKINKIDILEKKRLSQLDALIQEKKLELINYKNNIALQNQLKTKLKGQKVGQNILFVSQKAKKRKK